MPNWESHDNDWKGMTGARVDEIIARLRERGEEVEAVARGDQDYISRSNAAEIAALMYDAQAALVELINNTDLDVIMERRRDWAHATIKRGGSVDYP